MKEEEPGVTSYSGAFEQGGAKGKGERAFRPKHVSTTSAYRHDGRSELSPLHPLVQAERGMCVRRLGDFNRKQLDAYWRAHADVTLGVFQHPTRRGPRHRRRGTTSSWAIDAVTEKVVTLLISRCAAVSLTAPHAMPARTAACLPALDCLLTCIGGRRAGPRAPIVNSTLLHPHPAACFSAGRARWRRA